MFRKTFELLTVTLLCSLWIATQALASPMIQAGYRPADEAENTPLGLGAHQLLQIHETETFSYGSRWAGFGTLDISVDIQGEEFAVEILDTAPDGTGCSVYSEHVDGRVTLEASEDCDMDGLLSHLQEVAPYTDLTDRLGDWWTDSMADNVPGGGEDASVPGQPPTEREDGAGECTAAQGHCMIYVAAALATGLGTAAVATPFAGAVVGSIGLTGAILVCAGTIQDACNSFAAIVLDDLFADFPLDLGDPGSLLDGLDILQYVESLVDSLVHTGATELTGLGDGAQEEVDQLLDGLLEGLEAGLGA